MQAGAEADLNWFRMLEHHALRTPEKPIAVFEGTTLSYRQMLDRAVAAAGGLHARGVGFGDVVALLAHNHVDYLTIQFAANYLGAIFMPINWRLAAAEVRYLLEHSGAKVLICDDSFLPLGEEASAGLSDMARIVISGPDGPGWLSFSSLLASAPLPPPRAAVDGGDIQRLMYTSGTTGHPKGVMITHANLAWKNYAHITEFGFTAADVGLACGPLYHVGALDLVATSMIAVGATTIIHPRFDAEAVVAEIERSRISVVWMAPAMVRAILDLPGIEQRDLSSVRVLIAGGEKMPIAFIDRLKSVFSATWFADAYGLTETVSGDTFLDDASLRTKLGSVGRACLYLDLEIWDESHAPLPAGERGEVVLRGPKVFKGYWRDAEATRKAFQGGWFHTGDVGIKDQEGYVYIVDRLKDMIVSGGENIASSEVERVLYESESVLEAAVVGQADERWGEVPSAFVVLKPGQTSTPEALIDHCRQHLAKYKVPKSVTFVDALPRNPSGKVLKRALREML